MDVITLQPTAVPSLASKSTSAQELTSEQPIRPYIPKLGRFLIVVTFLEGESLSCGRLVS